MKIQSVRIIGMHKYRDITFNLLDMNYLYGLNGVGKSTVLQAIQFALLGYIPGTDKNKTAIFKHSNGNRFGVIVTFDNGQSISRGYVKTGKGITEKVIPDGFDTKQLLGNLEMPIMDFDQFIGMTANKMKDWFVDFLPDQDITLDWNQILTDSAFQCCTTQTLLDADLIPETVRTAEGISGSTLESIRQMNAYLKDSLSAKKQELARVEHTVQTLIYYADCDMSDSPESIREMINGETKNMQDLIMLKAHAESNAKYSAMYEAAIKDAGTESDRVNLVDQITEVTKGQVSIASECQYYSDLISEVDKQVFDKQRIANSKSVCPYTESKCAEIENLSEQYSADIISLKTRRDKLVIKYEDAKQRLAEVETKKKQMCADLDRMQNASHQVEKLKEMLYEDALARDTVLYDSEIAESQRHIETLRTRLSQIESNLRYEQLTIGLTNDKYRMEQTIEILKAWIKLTDVNGMQSELMQAPFRDLADRITAKLRTLFGTEDIKAAFNLEEKANSFSFGIIRSGSYIEYDMISSGEKCLYTLALIMSLTEMSNAQLKLLLVDDLLDHLDSEKIQACFKTLYNSNEIQIILAGVQECKHPQADSFVITII